MSQERKVTKVVRELMAIPVIQARREILVDVATSAGLVVLDLKETVDLTGRPVHPVKEVILDRVVYLVKED